jgi:hypothetical protein
MFCCPAPRRQLEHRAEKWAPVFRKSDATTNRYRNAGDSHITCVAIERFATMPCNAPVMGGGRRHSLRSVALVVSGRSGRVLIEELLVRR